MPSIFPSSICWRMSHSASEAICVFGITMKCTGARGWMSWKAKISSSSNTFRLGISPRTILQNRQLSMFFPPCADRSAFFGARALRITARGLLVDPRNAFAALEFHQHVVRSQAVAREHDQAVEPEVGEFVDQREPVAGLGG